MLVSKDSLDKLRKFAQRDHLTFSLLSDPDLTVHKLYGAYGEKKLYGKVHVGVIRSTLVINPDGSVGAHNVRAKGHDSLLKAMLDKLGLSISSRMLAADLKGLARLHRRF